MKTIKKDVHYCEFCNKRSLSKGHMNTHERHCTANPDRECRMCKEPNNIREIVAEYKTRFTIEEIERYEYEGSVTLVKDYKAKWIGAPITLEEVRNRVEGCPNCMLAIIRQSKFAYHYFEGMEFGEFDYKKEVQENAPNHYRYNENHY